MDNQIDPFDRLIGANLRRERLKKEISQTAIGQMIEPTVTFQQIQKYEKGINRISGNYIYQFARALDISVMNLYDQADILFGGNNVEIKEPDRDEIAMIINYQKVPSNFKPHIHNLVKDLADGFKPNY